MDRIAVFVDAGYLFAQGSAVLTGSQKPRINLELNAAEAIRRLKDLALDKGPNCKILRIYWYDGAIGGARPTSEQNFLAHLDDIKLRLGFVNNSGKQKGVDSLIVTDLIELARLKSISEAVLLAGDEDLRIGVQIAQNYGVRVHLLGIKPARGSQSLQLLQEADTTTEWDEKILGSFLTVRGISTEEGARRSTTVAGAASPALSKSLSLASGIEDVVDGFVKDMSVAELQSVRLYWADGLRGLPSDLDRVLLAKCRTAVGRDLEGPEKTGMRSHFQSKVYAIPDEK